MKISDMILFKYLNDDTDENKHRFILFCGIKLCEWIATPERKIFRLFNVEIYKRKLEEYIKKYYIFGLCLFKKLPSNAQILTNQAMIEARIATTNEQILASQAMIEARIATAVRLIFRNSEAAALHPKTFGEYRNKFQGKEVVLIATGPTVNDYIPLPHEGVINVGVNRAFLFDKVEFDFLFTIDNRGIEDYQDVFLNYKGNNCVKFMGTTEMPFHQCDPPYQIPMSFILKIPNVRRYKTFYSIDTLLEPFISMDIDIHPLWNSATIAIEAMQFILFTNPKKIYLVGCDCSSSGAAGEIIHFVKMPSDDKLEKEIGQYREFMYSSAKKDWQTMKEFASLYYPETEIISINPVGLKGLFKDIYQVEKGVTE